MSQISPETSFDDDFDLDDLVTFDELEPSDIIGTAEVPDNMIPLINKDTEEIEFPVSPDSEYQPMSEPDSQLVEVYEKLPAVEPIRRVIEPLSDDNRNLPGVTVTDQSGRLFKKYFVNDGLAANNIRSFDNFIINMIPEIMARKILHTPKYFIRFGNVTPIHPRTITMDENGKEVERFIFPSDAEAIEMDYSGAIRFDAFIQDRDTKEVVQVVPNIHGGMIPVMLGSSLCNTRGMTPEQLKKVGMDPYDPMGYFVAKGASKIILIQEQVRTNDIKIYFMPTIKSHVARMTIDTPSSSYVVQLNHEEKSDTIKLKYGKDDKRNTINSLLPFLVIGPMVNNGDQLTSSQIFNSFIKPFVNKEHHQRVWQKLQNTFADLKLIADPIDYLIKFKSLKNLDQWHALQKDLQRADSKNIYEKADEEAAMEGIAQALLQNKSLGYGKTKQENLLRIHEIPPMTYEEKVKLLQLDLINTLFPQFRQEENMVTKKLYMLGMMIARLSQFLIGVRDIDDRDDWGNKQLETPGRSMEKLFRSLFNEEMRLMQQNLDKLQSENRIADTLQSFGAKNISDVFSNSIGTNNWGRRRNDKTDINMVEAFTRDSQADGAAFIAKINTPATKKMKKAAVRMVQPSQIGYVCPVETPESDTCLTLDTVVAKADGSQRLITDFSEDTDVTSYNPALDRFETDRTSNYFELEAAESNKRLYRIETISGRVIKATDDHPFMIDGRWVAVRDLQVGDCVMIKEFDVELGEHMTSEYARVVENGSDLSFHDFYDQYRPMSDCLRIPIKSITEIPSERVADFRVAKNSSFVANGFVVHNCGLVKHTALTCRISVGRSESGIRRILEGENLVSFANLKLPGQSVVLLNGTLLGWCDGESVRNRLIKARRSNLIPIDTCIYLRQDVRELVLMTNSSRPTRPLLIAEFNKELGYNQLVIDRKNMWDADHETLLREGCVEYIDALEQRSIFVATSITDFAAHYDVINEIRSYYQDALELLAMIESYQEDDGDLEQLGEQINTFYSKEDIHFDDWKSYLNHAQKKVSTTKAALDNAIQKASYTHCELDPSAILGMSASLIPHSHNNQGPRNIYQSSMGKQALGVVHSTLSHRMVNSKAMINPNRPYSATQTAAMLGMDELPAGANVSIAFMSYSGQNQEDAIYVSEEFANNGGFRYSVSHIFKANDAGGNATSTEYFAHPGASVKKDPSLYHAIDSNGLPRPESTLNTGDCVIGKVRRTVENGKETFRDESVYLTVGVEGRVERVLVANSGGQVVVKVKIRQTRVPVRGDKLASRHAQKSTIGQIIPKSQMPFDAITGATPDIIINDKAIPSRMTIGMLIEVLTSQAAAMLDTRVDATAFRYITQKGGALDDLRRILKQEFVFNDLGNTKMRSGTTGEIFNSRIFTGIVHYQVLRHLVQFKYQARGGTGPTSLSTRQPVSGRIRSGGGRFGEMETWALVAHNGSGLLKDKACYSSDPFKAVYCKKCGIKATRRYGDNKYICTGCETQSDEDLGTCTTPYSMRMFGEMLRAAGLNILYKFEKAKE